MPQMERKADGETCITWSKPLCSICFLQTTYNSYKKSWANDKYQHKRQSHHHHHHHHWHKRSGDALNPCLVLTTKGFWGRGSRQRRTFHFKPSSGAAHSYFSQNLNRFLKLTSKPQTRPDSWSWKDTITSSDLLQKLRFVDDFVFLFQIFDQ